MLARHDTQLRGFAGWLAPRPRQAPPADCGLLDGNLLGVLGGAAVGGLVGSQIGSGDGQLAATAAGTLGGAMLGNAMTRGSGC